MAHPRMYDDSNPAIKRLREVCLALPEAFEKEAWGECTFRVTGGSMFAMTDNNHHQSGHVAVWVKAPLPRDVSRACSAAGAVRSIHGSAARIETYCNQERRSRLKNLIANAFQKYLETGGCALPGCPCYIHKLLGIPQADYIAEVLNELFLSRRG